MWKTKIIKKKRKFYPISFKNIPHNPFMENVEGILGNSTVFKSIKNPTGFGTDCRSTTLNNLKNVFKKIGYSTLKNKKQ